MFLAGERNPWSRHLAVAAGLAVVAVVLLCVWAGKLTPRVRTRIADPLLLAGSAGVVGGGCPGIKLRWEVCHH